MCHIHGVSVLASWGERIESGWLQLGNGHQSVWLHSEALFRIRQGES